MADLFNSIGIETWAGKKLKLSRFIIADSSIQFSI